MKKNITTNELFEFYSDILSRCGMHLLDADDEKISYDIFEEFDIGIISFFYPNNLLKLYENGYISKNKMNKSIELRKYVLELQNTNDWNLESFRSSERWKRILMLSDEIKIL